VNILRLPDSTARTLRLARKELTEILRDRRTIITLVLMPVLLYPLLSIGLFFFSFVGLKGRQADAALVFRMAFSSEAEEKAFIAYLQRGVEARAAAGELSHVEPRLYAGHYPDPRSDLPIPDVETAVRQRAVDVGFRARKPGSSPEQGGEWDLIYRDDSDVARDVINYLDLVLTAADADVLRARLKEAKAPARPVPRFLAAPLAVERQGGRALAVFVPLVLILMTVTGAVYPAIDLTAGERERGTLELLIAAPVPRVSLLFAKYVAVVAVAVLTALMNLGSMSVCLVIIDVFRGGVIELVFGPGGIRFLTLIQIFIIVLVFAAFFSAVLLVLTSFARSFKEAQAYLIPLMVVAILPGVLGLVPSLSLASPLAIVPLLNIVLLSRDLLEGQAEPVSAAVVVLCTALYAGLALMLAARVFGAEGVLYTETGGWRMLLRRRS
jgi:ABC-2 type transport system permease protein/sodium transport system permease protein